MVKKSCKHFFILYLLFGHILNCVPRTDRTLYPTDIIKFKLFYPAYCLLCTLPSGMSCKHIAIAKDKPNFIDAPNPDPIANPSGKLCKAKPMLTTIPVFNMAFLLFLNLLNLLNFLSTNKSHIIIIIIPKNIPKNTADKFVKLKASGNKSKHTIANISPDANAKIKLKNFLDVFFNFTPITPPIVVPKVPKNNPIKVVFNISFKIKTPLK